MAKKTAGKAVEKIDKQIEELKKKDKKEIISDSKVKAKAKSSRDNSQSKKSSKTSKTSSSPKKKTMLKPKVTSSTKKAKKVKEDNQEFTKLEDDIRALYDNDKVPQKIVKDSKLDKVKIDTLNKLMIILGIIFTILCLLFIIFVIFISTF